MPITAPRTYATVVALMIYLATAPLALAQQPVSVDKMTSAKVAEQLARNPNDYVLSVQTMLADKGLYSGKLSGQLTQTTIAAINRYCEKAGITEQCKWGPLSGIGSAALIGALIEEGAKPADMPQAAVTEAPAAIAAATRSVTPTAAATAMPPESVPSQATAAMPDPVVAAGDGVALPLQDGTSLAGWSTALGTTTLEDGRYRVVNSGTEFSVRLFRPFETETGKSYTLHASGYDGTASADIAVSNTSNISGALLTAAKIGEGFEKSFVATADITYLLLVAPAGVPNSYAEFDDIEVVAD